MEQPINNPTTPQVPQTVKDSSGTSALTLIIAALIIGLAIGFAASYRFVGKNDIGVDTSDVPGVASNLSVSAEMLQNPALKNWTAQITGKIIELSDNSITIQDSEGNRVSAFISSQAMVTRSVPDPENPGRYNSEQLTRSDLSIGNNVSVVVGFKDGQAEIANVALNQ